MSGLVAVVPVLDEDIGRKCVESIKASDSAAGISSEDLLIVDNTKQGILNSQQARNEMGWLDYTQWGNVYRDPEEHNIGVAASWNVGARKVLEEQKDYLVIVSASMIFGPELHTTWVAQMERWWGHNVIEAEIHSWHLIALHRRLFEEVGLFDENFYPGYFEQTDWCYRLRMKGLEHGFIRVPINAMSTGVGQHISLVDCPATPLLNYYAEKWGGPKGEETFVQPYGNKPIDHWIKTPIPELAKRYGLVNWW